MLGAADVGGLSVVMLTGGVGVGEVDRERGVRVKVIEPVERKFFFVKVCLVCLFWLLVSTRFDEVLGDSTLGGRGALGLMMPD